MADQSDALDAFRANVRERLRELDWPIAELARRINGDRPYLSRMLNGHEAIGLNRADMIAKALGTDLQTLITPSEALVRSA